MKGIWIAGGKDDSHLLVYHVNDHRPEGIDKKVVAMDSARSTGCHLEQEGAVTRNEV